MDRKKVNLIADTRVKVADINYPETKKRWLTLW
jgi:hypothetical protein